eukprot:XP_001610342.1 hypothetical protein [Babesia bovis T2Bo]
MACTPASVHKGHTAKVTDVTLTSLPGVDSESEVCDTHRNSNKPGFSKCVRLAMLYDRLLCEASKDDAWKFNITEISYELPRGKIAKSLYDLEQYLNDLEVTSRVTHSNLDAITSSLCVYVLEFFLEAEWLCLSKGFSSACVSLLRTLDTGVLSITVDSHVSHLVASDCTLTIHRRISDLHALAECDDILCLLGDDAVIAFVGLLNTIGLDTHDQVGDSNLVTVSDNVSYQKSRILALKGLNLLLFHRGPRNAPVCTDRIDIECIDAFLCKLLLVFCDQTADRDVLCQCGATLIGLLYAVYYVDKIEAYQSGILRYLGSYDRILSVFTGNESGCLSSTDRSIESCNFGNPDELFTLMVSLPSMGHLSVIRGILTFVYSFYGKDFQDNSIEDLGVKDNFVVQCLRLSFTIFKSATDNCLRVDVNYSTLQGLQLFMSFITHKSFHNHAIFACLEEMPSLILTYWTRKVRRISNLAVCTWSKLMEITFSLLAEYSDHVVLEYSRMLVSTVTDAFSGNLKLRYLGFQNVLKCVGPEEVLRLQPFLIPHLIDSLTIASIKGSAIVLLTELVQRIYDKARFLCTERGVDVALIVTQCLLYPCMIAVMHCKQLVVKDRSHGHLIPQQNVSREQLDTRSYALAESFKNIFRRIDKDYVCEMLRLSTTFSQCTFYQYLVDQDRELLQNGNSFLLKGHFSLVDDMVALIDRICTVSEPETVDHIIPLEAPFHFTESICLWNARSLNRVNFVDTVVDGTPLKGALIVDSLGSFKFDVTTLSSHTQVRLFYIPLAKLKEGLLSLNSDISINVLKAVACCPKTRQPLEKIELELMLFALHHCLKTSIPSYRQHFVAAIKPFMRRLLSIVTFNLDMLRRALEFDFGMVSLGQDGFSVIDIHVNPDDPDDAFGNLVRHCGYFMLVLKTLTNTLNPCTSDFRNTTALEVLHITLQMLAEDMPSALELLHPFFDDLVVPMFTSLFYMSTRQQDLILKSLLLFPSGYVSGTLSKDGEDNLKSLSIRAASCLWSVKSTPYISGAKALTLLLFGLDANDNTKTALSRFDLLSAIMMSKGTSTVVDYNVVLLVLGCFKHHLECFMTRLATSVDVLHPELASSPAGLLSLISHYMDAIPPSVYCKVVDHFAFEGLFIGLYGAIKDICNHILKYVGHESEDAVRDSKDYQIDCRGHLITRYGDHSYEFISDYENLYIDCCLCSDGFECTKIKMKATPKCSVPDDSNLRPFTVLCWKTIYECTGAMRSVLQWILPQSVNGSIALETVRNELIVEPGANVKMLYDITNDLGRYIIAALMKCRHFGCTDALADLLTWICRKLVIIGLQRCLKEWLFILLEQLKGHTVADEQWNEIFTMLRDSHRRSEPIARAFTSILKSESDRHKPVLLPFAVDTLLNLCKTEPTWFDTRDRSFTDVDIRIHSLNILCALFRCKELRWSNNIHAGDALCASLCNMSHGDWSVRNSAALLFSSVLHHITGSEVNVASTDALLDQKLTLCHNAALSNELNRILLDIKRMTVDSSESYENLNPVPEYAALYQSSAFVFNFLIRIPLYTFPGDVACQLTQNIGSILYSTNASIRIMSAKLLAKNSADTSESSVADLLLKTCRSLVSTRGGSNCVNGNLMLITECLDLMIDNGFDGIMMRVSDYTPCIVYIRSIASMLLANHLSEVESLVLAQPLSGALLLTMYIVTITANCFENVVQAIKILERLCLLQAGVTSLGALLLKIDQVTSSAYHGLVESCKILALISSYVLGDKVLDRVRSFMGIDAEMVPLTNPNLMLMLMHYRRIREDDTVKLRAASSLVDSMFLLHNFGSATSSTLSYDDFTTFLLKHLSGIEARHRVLQAALERVVYYLDNPAVASCGTGQLLSLWHLGIEILGHVPPFYVCTVVVSLFNAIGRRLLQGGLPCGTQFFNQQWSASFIALITERLLYNSDFFIQVWTCCHLYALLKHGDSDIDSRVLSMGAGLLLKAVDPGTDIVIRMPVAVVLRDIGICSPRGGRYCQDAIGMYVTHVLMAMLVLLQDDNEELRAVATMSGARIVASDGSCRVSHMKSDVFIQRLLEFALASLPPQWLVRLLQQLTMLSPDIYKTVDYRLERARMDASSGDIRLTTAVISPLPDNMDTLAEMDTVFNVEPQNMYTETLVYMVSVDRLLCKILGELNCEDLRGDAVEALRDFANTSSQQIMHTLVDHVSKNYEVRKLQHVFKYTQVDIESIQQKPYAALSDRRYMLFGPA